MEILKKISELKKSIEDIEYLVEKLISNINVQHINVDTKEEKISHLKAEIKNNVNKIDEIIKNYNANS